MLPSRLACALIVAVPLLLIARARRRHWLAAARPISTTTTKTTKPVRPAPKKKPPPPEDDSDSEEVEDDEPTKALWKKIEAVLADFSLSPLMVAASRKWIRQMSDPSNEELSRLRQWMLMRVNGRERAKPLSEWQRGCPEIMAGLRAQPFWDRQQFEWLRPFEEHAAEIRAELLALRSQRGFQPLKIPNWASKNKVASPDGAGSVSHDAGDWNVFYLFLHEVQFPDNCARCPTTTRLLKALPRSYQHAFFSALTPGTHIIKHHGPTNKKLRIHLPLVGAAGSELRVADTLVQNREDQCMVFDDSFEHEAWHRGDETRVVLVFDVWHPDLSDKEVQFLSSLQRSRMRAEMSAEKAARARREAEARAEGKGLGPADSGEDFFQLLQDAQDLLPDNSWWVQKNKSEGRL